MKWSEFVKKCRTGYPASIPVIVAHIQKYLMDNPIDSETIIQTIIEYIEAHPDLYPIDDELSSTSENPVQNKIITAALENVTIPVDDELSTTSENPVQNKVINQAISNIPVITVDPSLSGLSENPVQNKVVTAALADKLSADVLDIQITSANPAMWSDGSSAWPGGSAPLGQSGTCYLATVTSGTGVSSCVNGDDFKPSEWSTARCPAPLWVYIGDATVYVATTEPPTNNITIRGLVIHNV